MPLNIHVTSFKQGQSKGGGSGIPNINDHMVDICYWRRVEMDS